MAQCLLIKSGHYCNDKASQGKNQARFRDFPMKAGLYFLLVSLINLSKASFLTFSSLSFFDASALP